MWLFVVDSLFASVTGRRKRQAKKMRKKARKREAKRENRLRGLWL